MLAGEVRVLLIDLENSVGTTPRRRVLDARVKVLLAAAGTVHHAVAGYSGADLADDVTGSALAELGVGALRVAPGPDASETVLLAHARRVHASLGCRSFLAASGDHRFAELAELGRLELLVWHDQPVATRLEDSAHRVHRLPRPTGTTAHDLCDSTPSEEPPEPATSLHAVHPQSLAVAVTAVLAGIGFGVGQCLADVLLRR